MRDITGATRVLLILADPVAQVRTPAAVNRLAAERGADMVMVPFQVAASDLAPVLASLRRVPSIAGMVVTVPHKAAAAPLCDRLGEQARRVGAVNAIRRESDGTFTGEIFDGIGCVEALRRNGLDPYGCRALLLGAGGAAAAIAFALAEAGVTALGIANRTEASAAALAMRVAAAHPALVARAAPADPRGYDLVLNATVLGMRADDPPPLDPALLLPTHFVADITMQAQDSALLSAARARSCRVQTGGDMLAAQLPLIADYLHVGT